MKKSFWQKQIPTLIGVGILVVALVVGVFVFTIGGGAGVFAPRATPQTTPKKIKITNVTDTSFTVSFLTDEATAGFVTYGTEANDLSSRSGDDRDQLTGSVGNFNTHHITVRGLSPNKTYYFLIGTGTRSTFDNNGQPFTVQTTQRSGAPGAAKTAYGNVVNATGNPAEGAIVYASIDGVGELSSLVKNSGSWAIPLSNARTADGSGYAQITDSQSMSLFVQGPQEAQTSNIAVLVEESQPVPNITLGQNTVETPTTTTTTTTTTDTTTQTTQTEETVGTGGLEATQTGDLEGGLDSTSTSSGTLDNFGSARQLAQAETTQEPFGTTNPFPIGGTASPSATATESATITSTTSATTTPTSTPSSRVTMPATTSALPKSGSVGTTLTLLIGGLFFLIAGGWSFWISNSLQDNLAVVENGTNHQSRRAKIQLNSEVGNINELLNDETQNEVAASIDESTHHQTRSTKPNSGQVNYQLPDDVPLI